MGSPLSNRPVLTVTALTHRIKRTLESSFTSLVVQGELSGCKMHASGHFYFTLKDESSQISGVMWRSRVPDLRFVPADGMKVTVTGRVMVYEVRGTYQIEASGMRPLGIGELQIAFEQLKEKLAAEGLFDPERKKHLPEFPERIGIVTSPGGAALHDMLNILRRRFPGLEVVIRHVQVQGPGAAVDIAEGIREMARHGDVDLMIVGRGGGSYEDLWAFNEEPVARAIGSSPVPVISAVGHEVDFTIADFVADLRAPTPSAAAELAVRDRIALLDILRRNWYTMHESITLMLKQHRNTVQHLLHSYAFNKPLDTLRQHAQRLDEIHRALGVAGTHSLAITRANHDALHRRLLALDSAAVLRRGYVIVTRSDLPVTSSRTVRPDDTLRLRFHDGEVTTRVTGR